MISALVFIASKSGSASLFGYIVESAHCCFQKEPGPDLGQEGMPSPAAGGRCCLRGPRLRSRYSPLGDSGYRRICGMPLGRDSVVGGPTLFSVVIGCRRACCSGRCLAHRSCQVWLAFWLWVFWCHWPPSAPRVGPSLDHYLEFLDPVSACLGPRPYN